MQQVQELQGSLAQKVQTRSVRTSWDTCCKSTLGWLSRRWRLVIRTTLAKNTATWHWHAPFGKNIFHIFIKVISNTHSMSQCHSCPGILWPSWTTFDAKRFLDVQENLGCMTLYVIVWRYYNRTITSYISRRTLPGEFDKNEFITSATRWNHEWGVATLHTKVART